MTSALPNRPNLTQLKHQAKDLLKAHRAGDANCCHVIRRLRQFADEPDAAIFAAKLKLGDCQFALAMSYGFTHWDQLKRHVEQAAAAVADELHADQIMANGARDASGMKTIHICGQVRTTPADNFGAISPEADMVPIELWREFDGDRRWRIEKPTGRTVVMDGRTTRMLIADKLEVVIEKPTQGAFDSDWLYRLASVQRTVSNELQSAISEQRQLQLTHDRRADGTVTHVIDVIETAAFADGDYSKNRFMATADTRRVYRFDAATGRLSGVAIYCRHDQGDVLVFQTQTIDYDPVIDAKLFTLEVPATAQRYEEPTPIRNNADYQRLSPKEAASMFFKACADHDWPTAEAFYGRPIASDTREEYLADLAVLELGEPFHSKVSFHWYVPYEIRLKSGKVRKHNLALKKNENARRFIIDGGI